MKGFFQRLFGGGAKILSPAEFTREFANALRAATPGAKVEILEDLKLKLTAADNRETTGFLSNAYDLYAAAPESKAEIIQKFVAANQETLEAVGRPVQLDRSQIVPIIKDRGWLEELHQAMIAQGAKEMPQHVYEDFNADLIVMYAENTPKNIRYFWPDDLAAAGIERTGLRELACDNLRRMLPKLERHGDNGLYMFVAGGDFEASLLLADSIWDGLKSSVTGEVVVAIPTRDMLIATGSEDAAGLEQMRKIVAKVYPEGSYRLTPKLFIRRDGKFSEFIT